MNRALSFFMEVIPINEYLFRELVNNGLIQAGYFIEVETLEAMKKLIKSERLVIFSIILFGLKC